MGLDARKYYKENGKGGFANASVGPGAGSAHDEGCFVTTACVIACGLPDDCAELEILRKFRDSYVSGCVHGKEDIRLYYRLAPSIVAAVSARQDAAVIWREVFDQMVTPCVRMIREGQFADACEHYKQYAYLLWVTYMC